MRRLSSWLVVVLITVGAGCAKRQHRSWILSEATDDWIRFEPEGAVCANGSQYKYFINFSETSDNLVIFFEGGGACWNYEDCANAEPLNTECIKEPEGTECIRDDYTAVYLHLDELEPFTELTGVVNGDVPLELARPILSSNAEINPMAEWNKVFIPYCTGDTYLGNIVRTYKDPKGVGPDVEFHHKGHHNTLLIIEDLNRKFHNVPKMMVSGCSAGGVGSLNNYAFIRDGMRGVDKSYLIADGGPVIPGTLPSGEPSHSTALYERVRPAWNVGAMIASLPLGADRVLDDYGLDSMRPSPPFGADRVLDDYGEMNALLAESFPNDRLTISIFERDYNFTVSSYEDFFPIFAEPESSVYTGAGRTEIYRLASEDLEALRARFDDFENLSYYMPYYRNTNDSHCLTVTGLDDVGSSVSDFIDLFQTDPSEATWAGTALQVGSDMMTFKDFIEHVLDDSEPLQSHYEGTCEGKFQVCALDCAVYDESMCEDVVQ